MESNENAKTSNSISTLTIVILALGFLVASATLAYSLLSYINDTPSILGQQLNKQSDNSEEADAPFPTIKKGTRETLAKFTYSVIENSFSTGQKTTNYPSTILLDIPEYEKVYVTLLVNNEVKCCQGAIRETKDSPKKTVFTDLESATKLCLNDSRFNGQITQEEARNATIVFTLLSNRTILVNGVTSNNFELGVNAIEIINGNKSALYKESVAITSNYTLDEMLAALCKKAGLHENCKSDTQTNISKYDTITFKSDPDLATTSLYRYNIPIREEQITKDLLKKRVRLASQWLFNNYNVDTSEFHYAYVPVKDEYSEGNNYIRQLASLWALSDFQVFLEWEELLPVINDSQKAYLDQYMTCTDTECTIKVEGLSTIAHNAFIIMTLLNSPDYSKYQDTINKLAQAILNNQQDNGSYAPYFSSDTTNGIEYYPGEATLALMKLYEKTNNPQYLSSVEKALPYYKKYWEDNKNTAMIPWHTQTYFMLFQHTKNEQLKSDIQSFIFEANDWLIDNHQIEESQFPDLIGGFSHPFPTASTYVYLEGLGDAHALAILVKDTSRTEKYKESIKSGIRYTLENQYTLENGFYITNKERAVGGFRKSPVSSEERIDNTQHAGRALIKAYTSEIFE